MCAISCAGLQLKAKMDAKHGLVLETWICLKLLFFSELCDFVRLISYTDFMQNRKTLMFYACYEMLDQNLSMDWFIS